MNPDSWPAPAKLNLFLHILGRRPDGYHTLQTVFQLLEFGDELEFTVTQHGRIDLQRDYDDIHTQDDLVFRAASLLQARSGVSLGATITVNKQIPVGGGLGGGSSDAATTLLALNHLWGCGLSLDVLAEIGLQLGADVPVFIAGQSAWAEGVGEQLVPITLSAEWFLVIYPACQVNTGEVFNLPDLTRNTSPITIRDFLAGAGHNDCENAVLRHYPDVAAAAEWLGQWTGARLTGTGSCLFGRFENKQAANDILARLPGQWQGFVSKGCNISPLHRKLERLKLAQG
jgi:4-diphosphocytidyl-2-C-methyl-D-erythritol kinase